MTQKTKPIYLLADSQLLFLNNAQGKPVFSDIPQLFADQATEQGSSVEPQELIAAYIGASNGDEPVFFELFQQAMARIGIHRCHMVSSRFTNEEKTILQKSHLILLAGGDSVVGWKAMKKAGIPDILIEKHNQGTVLMGVSAGAMQLGWQVPDFDSRDDANFLESLKLVPFLVSAHEEEPEWPFLQKMVSESASMSRGIGIPYGGALVYHPEGEGEIRGAAATEVIFKDESFHISLLT